MKLAFVIGGAQKSGTTTLDALFRLHPAIQMADVKETHFFDDETRDWSAPDYAPLHARFSNDTRLKGEATPVTLYWRPAIRRLHAYNPAIRFVFLLRDPVTRAFASWKKEYAAGLDTLSFEDAVAAYPGRVRDMAETEGLNRVVSYIERGFYGAQLAYLTGLFPKAQVHCEIYEEFFADRAAGLGRIARFLGLAPFPAAPPALRRHPAKEIAYPSTLTPEIAARLHGIFRDDIAEVERFLGRPIPAWRRDRP
jgi:hypothetical protein